ncbi:ABC transporter substrate-binding protein [Nonomuraea ferruginea]
MMYRPLQEGKLFARNKYLADLTEQVKSESWDFSDFQPGPAQSTTYESKPVGIPIITEQEVLYYRKDLLEKAGLSAPPKTLDELKAAAAKIKESEPDVAGFVARTGKSAAVTQFSSFLYSFGGDFVDQSGKSAVGTDAAKQAYAYYGELIKDYGPANVSTDMGWPEAMAIFTQGKAAFYTEANSLYKNATDADKSKVSDQVGFAPFPAQPGGLEAVQHPVVGAGHQRRLREHRERLEVHRVGHGQGADARPAEVRRAGRPDLGLGRPRGRLDLPRGPGRGHRGQHRERRRP